MQRRPAVGNATHHHHGAPFEVNSLLPRAYAFASIVLITYMSALSATDYAASQYALLTSLCALPGSLLAGLSGFVIEWTGFTWFFVGTSLIGVPVALLCLLVARRHGPMDAPEPAP